MSLDQQRRNTTKIPILLYIPNILGYVRILLAFLGMYYSLSLQHHHQQSSLLLSSSSSLVAIGIWILASVLDLFDGILARLLHQTSYFGTLLDIIADNILRTIIWICVCNVSFLHHYNQQQQQSLSIHDYNNDTSINNSNNNFITSHSKSIIIFASFIICIEWTTMICTQLQAAASAAAVSGNGINRVDDSNTNNINAQHWKVTSVQNNSSHRVHPNSSLSNLSLWLMTRFFQNNFRNPIGLLGIYGLFAMNLFIYGCYNPDIDQIIHQEIMYKHLYNTCMYLAITGRFLSLYIELQLCYNYISFIIMKEQKEKDKTS